MTPTDVLTKAIELAKKNGWLGIALMSQVTGVDEDTVIETYAKSLINDQTETALIYNHDFARALWGEEETSYDVWSKRQFSAGGGGPDEDWYDGQLWQYHLQQMVISPDPIDYLAQNLPNDSK